MRAISLLTACLITLATLAGCASSGDSLALQERRSSGSLLDDQAIEIKIQELIYTDESIKRDIHVNVTVYNGYVLLSGETPTQEMRDKVVKHAQRVGKVRQIYNETVIAPPSDHKARRQDAFITTKAKAALMGRKEINGLGIKVVTEAQTVYLMGIVTEAEGNLAAETVRPVQGVAQIVKLFEYHTPAAVPAAPQ